MTYLHFQNLKAWLEKSKKQYINKSNSLQRYFTEISYFQDGMLFLWRINSHWFVDYSVVLGWGTSGDQGASCSVALKIDLFYKHLAANNPRQWCKQFFKRSQRRRNHIMRFQINNAKKNETSIWVVYFLNSTHEIPMFKVQALKSS